MPKKKKEEKNVNIIIKLFSPKHGSNSPPMLQKSKHFILAPSSLSFKYNFRVINTLLQFGKETSHILKGY
jgi:hypothetical protein